MSHDFLKTIIEDEIKNVLIKERSLYVFDFDDTLVTDQATVYVQNEATGKKFPLSVTEFHHYTLKENEVMDFGEFEQVTNPKIHKNILNLLLQYLPNSAILTARGSAEPIKDFLESLGIYVPEIIAVGDDSDLNHNVDSVLENAKRKRIWINNAIQQRGLEHVEFWDDNLQNIFQVKKLAKKYPNVKIITHRVIHR